MTADQKREQVIFKDIENWAEGRIHQWFDDTRDRFEQGGFDERKAFMAAASILMIATVDVIAATQIDPVEGGETFMEAVKHTRRRQLELAKRMRNAAPTD